MSNDQYASSTGGYEPRGLMRFIVRWLTRHYYPRLEIDGRERIPQTGPVLLCANHANSLIDPVIIGIAARRPVRFMAKAPLFDDPVLGPPMKALGMVPAFRGRDDASEVRRNLESLDVAANVLVEGRAMGIFPEGVSTDEEHLEMIRSGAGRMALQAVAEGAAGLLVVPIGIAYERKDQFRSAVLVRVAEPINVEGLLAEHDGNERLARRAFTALVEARLKEVVISLDEPKWAPWLDDLAVLVPPPESVPRTPGRRLWQRKRLADAINYFLANDRPLAESVAADVESYRDAVRAAHLTVDSPLLRSSRLWVALTLLLSAVWLALLSLPALYGTLLHIVPFVLVRRLAKRLDQPGRKTISTNRMLVGTPLYAAWYLVLGLLVGFFTSWPTAAAWLVTAPLTGIVAMYYWRYARRTARLLYHETLTLLAPGTLRRLRSLRAALCERLEELVEHYGQVAPRT
ncbi:MAG: 1-acyl-sn-glycerol-3-phosphate acyltransferase [Planctomycetales bacterium]|nr:1-acyl-sn-glycerol-3-phosphate acyltransferase [Planctomycetales bacterium]